MNAHVHAIRLRGPWQFEFTLRKVNREAGIVVEEGSGLGSGTIRLPVGHIGDSLGKDQPPTCWEDVLGSEFSGRVKCHRRFGCPTGLSAGNPVDLVLEAPRGVTGVWLNEAPLDLSPVSVPEARWPIGQLLMQRNLLAIEFQVDGTSRSAGSLPGVEASAITPFTDVRLEIHAAAG